MNLLADMGVQPDDAAAGAGRRHRLDRHHRAELGGHEPSAGAEVEAGRADDDHRHGDRRRRRRGRRRRGLGRRRQLASGPGPRELDLHVDAGRDRPGDDQDPRGRRQRQPRDAGRGDHGRCRGRQAARARSGPTRSCRRSRSDPGAVELGVKFRSDVAGDVTGLRFYKGPDNTGTHVGHLWTGSGHPARGRRRSPARAASGWQEVQFDAPGRDRRRHHLRRLLPRAQRRLRRHQRVLRRPGRRQPRRCMRSPTASTARTASTTTAPSGVFPTDTFSFEQLLGRRRLRRRRRARHRAAGDQPRRPGAAAPSDVESSANVERDLQRADGRRRRSRDNFELRDASDALVPATVSYAAATRTATLDPSSPLANSTTYTATVKGGRGWRQRHRRQPARRPTTPGRSRRRRRRRRRPTRGRADRSSSSATPRTRSAATTPRSSAPRA